jgi:hypothetical protein
MQLKIIIVGVPGAGKDTQVHDIPLSAVCRLLSAACCLLSAVCCVLSAVCCLLSAVCCLLSAVCCLLSAVCCIDIVSQGPSLNILLFATGGQDSVGI